MLAFMPRCLGAIEWSYVLFLQHTHLKLNKRDTNEQVVENTSIHEEEIYNTILPPVKDPLIPFLDV